MSYVSTEPKPNIKICINNIWVEERRYFYNRYDYMKERIIFCAKPSVFLQVKLQMLHIIGKISCTHVINLAD